MPVSSLERCDAIVALLQGTDSAPAETCCFALVLYS